MKIKLYLFLYWLSILFRFVSVFRIILHTHLLGEVNTWMPIGIYIYLFSFFLCLLKSYIIWPEWFIKFLIYSLGKLSVALLCRSHQNFTSIKLCSCSTVFNSKIVYLVPLGAFVCIFFLSFIEIANYLPTDTYHLLNSVSSVKIICK